MSSTIASSILRRFSACASRSSLRRRCRPRRGSRPCARRRRRSCATSAPKRLGECDRVEARQRRDAEQERGAHRVAHRASARRRSPPCRARDRARARRRGVAELAVACARRGERLPIARALVRRDRRHRACSSQALEGLAGPARGQRRRAWRRADDSAAMRVKSRRFGAAIRRRGRARSGRRRRLRAPRPSRAARARCRRAAAARGRRPRARRPPRARRADGGAARQSKPRGTGTLIRRCGNSGASAVASASVVSCSRSARSTASAATMRVAGRVLVEADEWPEFSPPSSQPFSCIFPARSGRRPARAPAECRARASACSKPRLLISVPTTPPAIAPRRQ